MDNPTSTPISNSTSKPNSSSSSSSSPSTEQKSSSTPQNKPMPQNVGGDQKNSSTNNDVKKENKDISAS
ncbi:MAG: hypothetical protein ACHQM6_06760 [Candidatus Kapaibacterium sp.]